MSNSIQKYIRSKIEERKTENNFRSLKIIKGLVDFCSNDYLGFARDSELKRRVDEEVKTHPEFLLGSTGSRLLSGNSQYAGELENFIAQFHNSESALLFNSGFDANYGLLSALPYKGDTILYDDLVHASIHDGINKSKASGVSFSHNNIAELEQKIKSATGLKYVVVESVYSMDGDFAPLKEIADLCEKYDAGLIVDEAHATGIFSEKGEGRVQQLKLEDKCLARVHTFGKALGAHGAVILCPNDLKDFLINYARPFIFSTGLPFHSLANIKCAYQYLPKVNDRRKKLFYLVNLLHQNLKFTSKFELTPSESPIQSVIISGNQDVKSFAEKIQSQGFDVRPILYPTVAKGKERIRVCIHSFNTDKEVIKLAQLISSL